MIIHRCDRCGLDSPQQKGETSRTPTGWQPISFGSSYSSLNRVYYEICQKCRTELKIPDDDRESQKDIGQRLLEIISEIVEEEVSEQTGN